VGRHHGSSPIHNCTVHTLVEKPTRLLNSLQLLAGSLIAIYVGNVFFFLFFNGTHYNTKNITVANLAAFENTIGRHQSSVCGFKDLTLEHSLVASWIDGFHDACWLAWLPVLLFRTGFCCSFQFIFNYDLPCQYIVYIVYKWKRKTWRHFAWYYVDKSISGVYPFICNTWNFFLTPRKT